MKRMLKKIYWLRNIPFFDNCKIYYNELKYKFTGETRLPNAKSQIFFSENKDRIEQIVSWFSDEESKKTYLKMIDVRATGNKKGFIYHGLGNQYFKNNFFRYEQSEIYIDCGAYIGDSIKNFIRINPNYEQIIAFEPEKKNYDFIVNKYKNYSKITIVNAGAFDKDGTLYFSGNLDAGKISEAETGEKIQVKRIDGLEFSGKVTFIKMDVEGSELASLNGAKETILRDKPKLAICLYHSDSDMICIPEFIHKLVPDYKLYVRQHMPYPNIIETVLYACL